MRKIPQRSLHKYLHADALKPHSSLTHPLHQCCLPSSQHLPSARSASSVSPKTSPCGAAALTPLMPFLAASLVFAQDFLVSGLFLQSFQTMSGGNGRRRGGLHPQAVPIASSQGSHAWPADCSTNVKSFCLERTHIYYCQ